LFTAWTYTLESLRSNYGELIQAHVSSGEILLADERLTMSAMMAAATAGESWIARYDENIPVIDGVISKARSLAPEAAIQRFDAETKVSNDRLVELERESFEAVRANDSKRAMEILTSPAYSENKTLLSDGTQHLIDAVMAAHQQRIDSIASWINFMTFCIAGMFIGGAWFLFWFLNTALVRSEREHDQVLNQKSAALAQLAVAYEEMENRVEERTSRLKAEIVMRETLQAKLRQAEKMEAIGTLAGGVAHELNNLLQPIIMMTELVLAEQPIDSRHSGQLLRVIDAGGKAADIVSRILAFGRVDEASHDTLDIGFVTREAISFIRTILPSSITLRVDIDDSVGLIRGDKTELTQVLISLATNARDAIGANIGTVWVSLSKTNVTRSAFSSPPGNLEPGGYAMLAVRDTGAGMDEATRQRIFEPFFTTKGVGKGTGLGLSVTHGIIASHGGTIAVESTPGRGTTFSVYVPLESIDAAVALTA
jgi:signal transduction histidine kinase